MIDMLIVRDVFSAQLHGLIFTRGFHMSSSASSCTRSYESSAEDFVVLHYSQTCYPGPLLSNKDVDWALPVTRSQAKTSSPTEPGPESRSPIPTTVPGPITQASSPMSALCVEISTKATRKRSLLTPHAKVEQRYRQKINDNLMRLAEVLPSGTYQPMRDMEDLCKRSPAGSKAAIIDAATRYIAETWAAYKTIEKANIDLADRTNEMRKLACCEDCPVRNLVAGHWIEPWHDDNGHSVDWYRYDDVAKAKAANRPSPPPLSPLDSNLMSHGGLRRTFPFLSSAAIAYYFKPLAPHSPSEVHRTCRLYLAVLGSIQFEASRRRHRILAFHKTV
ncbi:hypothetical protein KCU71_g15, partial [Aureobasidium melanogenum]